MKLGICLVLGQLVLGTCCVSAASASEVFIPRDLASVRDRAEGTNGRTILIIEEAHVDYGAQKALADLLKDLIENESLRYVFVEGGWGDVSLSSFKNLADPERRKEVAEEYLRQGKLSGEEYLNLATDLDMRIWGVETPELYEDNMNVFLKMSDARPRLLEALHQLEAQIKTLRAKALTPAMNELLDRRKDFDNQKLSLLEYVQFLMKHAQQRDGFPLLQRGTKGDLINLPSPLFAKEGELQNEKEAEFPHLSQLMALAGNDGSYDPDKVTPEKESAIRFLSQQLAKPELEEILFLKDQKTPEGELRFLEALFTKVRSFPQARGELSLGNLYRYKTVLEKAAHMDTSAIFEEIDQAGRAAILAQKPTPDQVALLDIIRGVQYLMKLFDLTLTPAEFGNGNGHEARIGKGNGPNTKTVTEGRNGHLYRSPTTQPETWNAFLEKMSKENNVPYQPFDAAEFEKYIPGARAFYETAIARENAMAMNTISKIEESDARLSALIIGGFHSPNLFRTFKERGYSVVLVSPRFAPFADPHAQHKKYLDVLKYKWTGQAKPEYQNTAEAPSAKIQIPGNFQAPRTP